MKKLNHKQRLDESLKNVKSIKTKKVLLSPKAKRITKSSIATLAVAGVVAGATVGIYQAITSDKESVFPFHAKDKDSTKYHSSEAYDATHKDPGTIVTHKQSGSSLISTAQRGGVKFISNYEGMFNDEKLKDMADWFYKDVNWGPEITTLHGINMLSGVQEDDGTVTLGYHTISRDQSIIVMSPDVVFSGTYPVQIQQNLSYWYTQATKSINGLSGYTGDQGYLKLYQDSKKGAASDSANDLSFTLYKKIIEDIASNASNFFGSNDKAQQISFETKAAELFEKSNWSSLNDDEKTEGIISILPSKSASLDLRSLLSTATSLEDKYMLFQASYKSTGDLHAPANTLAEEILTELQKTNPAIADPTDPNMKGILASSQALAENLANSKDQQDGDERLEKAFDNSTIWNKFVKSATTAIDSDLQNIKALIKPNLDAIASLVTNDQFKSIVASSGYKVNTNDMRIIMAKSHMSVADVQEIINYSRATDLANVGTNDPHFITQLHSLQSGSSEQVETTLSNLLISLGQTNQNNSKDEHVLALLKAAALLINWQGDRFGSTELYGLGASRMSLGVNAIANLYTEFTSMSKDDILKINAASLISKIKVASVENINWMDDDSDPDKGLSDQVKNDRRETLLKNIYGYKDASGNYVKGVKDNLFDYGTALNESLQKRLNPGDHDGINKQWGKKDGKATSGVPIWKDGDTPYDSLIRRMITDMEYTISHEYGHHLTMTYAQDITEENIVGEPDKDKRIVNSEALTEPSEDTLASKRRYELFKTAFDSDWFKKIMDGATDGDTKTDVSYQYFKGKGLVGDTGIQDLEYTSPGIRGENKRDPQIVPTLPTYRIEGDGTYTLIPTLNNSKTDRDAILQPLVKATEDDDQNPLVPDESSVDWIPTTIEIPWTPTGAPGSTPYKDYVKSRHLNNYLVAVYKKAIEITNRDKNLKGTAPNATALYEAADIVIGDQTRDLFDKSIGEETVAGYLTVTKNDNGPTGNIADVYKDDSADGLNNQILIFDTMLRAIKTILIQKAANEADVRTEAIKQLTNLFNGDPAGTIDSQKQGFGEQIFSGVKIEISKAGVEKIVDDMLAGKFYTFDLGTAYSPASVIFVFNHKGDETKYHQKFSAIAKGAKAPASFARYQMQYVEILTRLLQQTSFSVDAELLTAPGEYYSGDQMRFALFGEDFYDVMKRSSAATPDGHMTSLGQKAWDMWKEYFALEDDISTMYHSKDTGLSGFYGSVVNADKDKIDHLVFEDTSGKIVSSVEMIYNVDNYHVYDIHGDPTSREDMEGDRTSWMTNGMIIGDFANSQLKVGTYKLAFGKDKNGDGKISQDEIVREIQNGQVANNGVINNNGRSDKTAEIEGNPTDEASATDQFEVKINKVRV